MGGWFNAVWNNSGSEAYLFDLKYRQNRAYVVNWITSGTALFAISSASTHAYSAYTLLQGDVSTIQPYYAIAVCVLNIWPFPWPPPLCRWHSALFYFHPLNFDSSISHLHKTLFNRMTANLLTLNSSKTEFLLKGTQKRAKIHNSSLDTSHSARNLGFIFDEHLTFSGQITSLFKACYYHIRQLHCIRPYLDSSTACTIATSIVHSKLILILFSCCVSLCIL